MHIKQSAVDGITSMLNKRIYADPVFELVEQLAIHAQTAHEKSGRKETAFCAFLSTGESPAFQVRDFGSGYSLEEMVRVFSAHSVAADSFDGHGDLQAKAALGYTPSFLVRSFQTDLLHACVVSIDPDTLKPTPRNVESTPINGHPQYSGVSIVVPVEPKDIERYKTAMSTILPNFNVDVTVDGEKLEHVGVAGNAPSL